MQKPALSQVVHIPFIDFNNYVEKKYSIPKVTVTKKSGNRDVNYYDLAILDSHMFRGNDSSKNFYNQFLNESIDTSLKPIFSFLKQDILDVIFHSSNDAHIMNQEILKIPESDWIEAYIHVINNSKKILKQLGTSNEYWLGYMVAGLYESAIVSSYGLDDVSKHYNKYFWHISW